MPARLARALLWGPVLAAGATFGLGYGFAAAHAADTADATSTAAIGDFFTGLVGAALGLTVAVAAVVWRTGGTAGAWLAAMFAGSAGLLLAATVVAVFSRELTFGDFAPVLAVLVPLVVIATLIGWIAAVTSRANAHVGRGA
jgi:hypothetical protein